MSSSIAALDRAALPLSPRHAGPVLVATSGVDAGTALLVGRDLSARLQTGLRLLSALEADYVYLVGLDAGPLAVSYEAERRRDRMALVRRHCENVLGVDPRGSGIHIDVRVGDVARAVEAAALECGASLVVVGHERRDLARRLIMGESALRVARRAPCPTLVVPEALSVPVRSAVVGMDFSGSSIAAAREALRLLAPRGALHLVHVWPRLSDRDGWMREHDERYANALPERLARAAELVGAPAGVRVEATDVVGDTVEALLAYAARSDASLVAAGRRGHGRVEGLLVGSVTTRLARAVPCAVLVSPEPADPEAGLAEQTMAVVNDEGSGTWPSLLDDFARRNRGRRLLLEVASARDGTHVEAMGYELRDATYDPREGRVLLMLGHPMEESRLLTHAVPAVQSVTTVPGPNGRDVALRLYHRDAWTLLTFLSMEPG